MCDTFLEVPVARNKPVIFGKNSDREPNEAQQILCVPRQTREHGRIQATFIEAEHPGDTFEVILSKPFQMFGAEMGVNEHGVAIGNQAVFTKIPFDKKKAGLTGMDMLRMSLEVSKTAREALDYILFLLEKYGQDACGGYKNKRFYYHNSFLIGDSNCGFQLETAGKHWVYKKVKGFAAISNGLSINDDYDEISKGAIEFAMKKRWIKHYKTFSFKDAFSQFWMPKLASAKQRAGSNCENRSQADHFTVQDAFKALRRHHEPFDITRPDTRSVCMHSKWPFSPDATVGSMVAELKPNAASEVWMTGTSHPCISLFKPFFFGTDLLYESNFLKPGAMPDNSYWWQWEMFFRENTSSYEEVKMQMKPIQLSLEQNWLDRVKKGDKSVSEDALIKSEEILALLEATVRPQGRLGKFYEWHLRNINRQVGIA